MFKRQCKSIYRRESCHWVNGCLIGVDSAGEGARLAEDIFQRGVAGGAGQAEVKVNCWRKYRGGGWCFGGAIGQFRVEGSQGLANKPMQRTAQAAFLSKRCSLPSLLKFEVTMLAEVVYHQAGVYTPAESFPD